MTTILLLIMLLVIMAISVGIYTADSIEWGIDISTLRSTSFELGITNRNHVWNNQEEEQEFRMGFFFITIFISFFRNSA